MKAAIVKIGDIAEQIRGVSYGKNDAELTATPNYLPILRAGNITAFGLEFDDLVYVPKDLISERQKIRKGDVILAASSGSLDVVGKAAQSLDDYEGSFGAFCKLLRPNSKVDARYFGHYFKTKEYRTIISSLAAGANINNLRNEHIDNLLIPLPHLEEQKRIADILDKAEALRAKRRESIELINSLTQSIFLEMFGDPLTNSKKWDMVEIGSEVSVQGGFAFKSADYSSNGIRLTKISNVHKDNLVWDDIDFLPLSYSDKFKEYMLRKDDIVMALTRPIIKSLDSVKIARVHQTDLPTLLNQRVARFVFKEKSKVLPHFLLAFCKTKYFYSSVERLSSVSLQPNISTSQIEDIKILLPPLDLQEKFVDVMRRVEEHSSLLNKLSPLNDELFMSLQQQAFAGEL